MNKIIFLLSILLISMPVIAAKKQVKTTTESTSITSEETFESKTDEEEKPTAEDMKLIDDSDKCYDIADQNLKNDPASKSLSQEKSSELLDELFNSCMQEKGHQPEDNSSPDSPTTTEE